MLKARIFTLYPDFFPGYLGQGIFGKALSENKWKIDTVDIREYAFDKHKTVDDTPYGGGEGMLMKADVLAKSIDKNVKDGEKIIYLSPKGKLFNHQLAKQLSQCNDSYLIRIGYQSGGTIGWLGKYYIFGIFEDKNKIEFLVPLKSFDNKNLALNELKK